MSPSGTAAPARSVLEPPKITRTVEIPDHPGYTADVWVNFPRRLRQEIGSGDEVRIRAALEQIVIGHNGWPDDDGNVLPAPSEDAFWDALDMHLAVTLVTVATSEAVLPSPSAMPQQRASRLSSSQSGAAATQQG